MKYSEAQQKVIDTLTDTEESVLITGVAGSGKSTCTRHWRDNAPAADNAMILAPTGVAALNVGGSTIHRAFGFRPNMDTDNPSVSLKIKSVLHTADTILVDEVSMLRADLLHAMDVVLRSVKRKRDVPFGGVRMIFMGDFWQLPPVVRREEEREMEEKHGSRYGWPFFAPAFTQLSPEIYFLAQSFRQSGDSTFTDVLNAVRRGDPNIVNAINEIARPVSEADETVPRLCARKKDVARYNADGLRRLGVTPTVIHPDITGDEKKVPREVQEPLTLAEGARVMITRNGAGYVNGSVGTLVDFESEAELWNGTCVPAIRVRLDDGLHVDVPREEQEVIGYTVDEETGKPVKDVLATVSQYPLNLGYAWTIHKSQGQTLDKAVIDMGRGAFAHGQTYVALSRLRSAEGLYLANPITRSDLLLDPDVPAFFEQYMV